MVEFVQCRSYDTVYYTIIGMEHNVMEGNIIMDVYNDRYCNRVSTYMSTYDSPRLHNLLIPAWLIFTFSSTIV